MISIDAVQRGKAREKMLERELARLAGDNWQVRIVTCTQTQRT